LAAGLPGCADENAGAYIQAAPGAVTQAS